jgi:hypothetical protein
MPYLKNVMAGSLDSARDDEQSGMTHDASDAFDNTQIVASLVAPVSQDKNLAGEFRLVWTAQNHATRSLKEISRFRRAGGPEKDLQLE